MIIAKKETNSGTEYYTITGHKINPAAMGKYKDIICATP
jgi:hypothetical protein